MAGRADLPGLRALDALACDPTSKSWFATDCALVLLPRCLGRSLGKLSYEASVVVGVLMIALRQIWTMRMGMRGVVVSDYDQDLVANLRRSLRPHLHVHLVIAATVIVWL